MISLQLVIDQAEKVDKGGSARYGILRANHYPTAGDQIRAFLARYSDAPSLATILAELTDSDMKTPETLNIALRKMAKIQAWTTSLREVTRPDG